MVDQATFSWGDCQHPETEIVPEKRGPHHARKICKKCHKFLAWVPHPETVERERRNLVILTALSKIEDLTEWERGFIRTICTGRHLSPRQQEKLLLLKEKYKL